MKTQFIKNSRSHFLCLIIAGLLLFCSTSVLRAGMNFSRKLQGTDRKVTELLLLSMQARDAGDMANAELFWMHARELKPSLRRPAWLERQFEVPVGDLSDEEILKRIVQLPYDKARILLEEQIRKSPDNERLRSRYLELARENNDEIEIKRHESAMKKNEEGSSSAQLVFRYAIFLILVVLLVWQLLAFVNDLRAAKSDE